MMFFTKTVFLKINFNCSKLERLLNAYEGLFWIIRHKQYYFKEKLSNRVYFKNVLFQIKTLYSLKCSLSISFMLKARNLVYALPRCP